MITIGINNKNVIYRCLVFLLISGMVSVCHAGEQLVSFTPADLSILSGEIETLQMNYDVLSGEKQTTGLTLRIHYNSKQIESLSLKDMYGEGLLGQDYSAKEDIDDFDNDPLTDKYLSVGWVGLTGNWPAVIPPPMNLGKIVIKSRSELDSSETFINVSANSTPPGYLLVANKLTIHIQ